VTGTEPNLAPPKQSVLVELLAVPDRPKGLTERSDADNTDAGHDLRPVDPDVAPGLERAATVVGGHRRGRKMEPVKGRRAGLAEGPAVGEVLGALKVLHHGDVILG
jgi:hypothetical protein